MRRTLTAVVAAFLLAAFVSAAEPKWSRIDTPNFIVIGTQSEQALRDVGRQFEGFREALARLLSSAVTSTAVPTVVVAFPDDKIFQPFKPLYQGKPVDVAGLFMAHSDINYILLGPNRGQESLRPVFHEYSHLIINNVAPLLPLWLNEGLAEYYSSFELTPNGQAVVFGRAIPSHFRELGVNTWMPLPALLATTRESPNYNENARRGAFYAESWLLVHMFMHGQADRRQRFSAYLSELSQGVQPDAAWQHQFGGEDIYKALVQYSRSPVMEARLYKFSDKILRSPGVPVPLAPADAEGMLGEILLSMQHTDQAAQRFDRALALQPGSTRASVGKAIAAGKVALVPNTPAPSGDWFNEYSVGSTLLRQGAALDEPSLEAARAMLERAAAAQPDIPNVQVLFAMASDRSAPGSGPVVEALRKAHAAAPVRDDYTVMLARALARGGSFEAARMVLGQVIARPALPDSRALAIAAIDDIEAAEAAAKRRTSPAEPLPSDRSQTDASPPPSVPQDTYRPIGDGEQRVEGLLERMDCSSKRIEFAVKLPDRRAHFQAASLSAVEFISYRTDLQGSVTCGPRKPADPVYVTWRPGDLDGTVVAIEFLPVHR